MKSETHTRGNIWLLITLLFVSLIAWAAFDGSGVASAQTAHGIEEIRIGVLVDRSGPRRVRDAAKDVALQVAAEEVNEHLAAIQSPYRVRLVFADTVSEPSVALQRLSDLHNQGIRFVIGPNSSAELQHIKSFADQRRIILVSPDSTAPSLAVPGDTIYRFVMDDTYQAQALARLAWDDGVRVIIPFARRDVYADNLIWHLTTEFEALGGCVLSDGLIDVDRLEAGFYGPCEPRDIDAAEDFGFDSRYKVDPRYQAVRYSPSTSNFISELEKLASVVNEQVWRHGSRAVAVQLIAFDEVGQVFAEAHRWPALSSVRWYGTDGTANNEAILLDRRAADFAVATRFTSSILGQVPQARDEFNSLAERVRAKGGGELNSTAAGAYDALWVAALAHVTAGGSTDPGILAKAFEQIARWHFGASGWTALNSAGDRKLGSYDFWTVERRGSSYTWSVIAQYQFIPGAPPRLTRGDGR